MAKLCPTCQKKPQPAGTYRGQCTAKVSQDCRAWTDTFEFTLCDPCAEQLKRCAWCFGPLDGDYGGVPVPTSKRFVRVFHPRDNGLHVLGMNVGEQILAQFTVDRYSGLIWELDVRESSRAVTPVFYRFIQDAQNWRQATLEYYINLDHPCEKARLVFRQVPDARDWWWGKPPAGGATFEATVEIRP